MLILLISAKVKEEIGPTPHASDNNKPQGEAPVLPVCLPIMQEVANIT